jgi:hypothetical protein
MAFPKKNRRRIVLYEREDFWHAVGDVCSNLRVVANVP